MFQSIASSLYTTPPPLNKVIIIMPVTFRLPECDDVLSSDGMPLNISDGVGSSSIPRSSSSSPEASKNYVASQRRTAILQVWLPFSLLRELSLLHFSFIQVPSAILNNFWCLLKVLIVRCLSQWGQVCRFCGAATLRFLTLAIRLATEESIITEISLLCINTKTWLTIICTCMLWLYMHQCTHMHVTTVPPIKG